MGKFRDTLKKYFKKNNIAEKEKSSGFDKELGEARIYTKDAYDEEMHETVDEVGLSSEPKQVEALNKDLDNLGALIEMARNGEPSRDAPKTPAEEKSSTIDSIPDRIEDLSPAAQEHTHAMMAEVMNDLNIAAELNAQNKDLFSTGRQVLSGDLGKETEEDSVRKANDQMEQVNDSNDVNPKAVTKTGPGAFKNESEFAAEQESQRKESNLKDLAEDPFGNVEKYFNDEKSSLKNTKDTLAKANEQNAINEAQSFVDQNSNADKQAELVAAARQKTAKVVEKNNPLQEAMSNFAKSMGFGRSNSAETASTASLSSEASEIGAPTPTPNQNEFKSERLEI